MNKLRVPLFLRHIIKNDYLVSLLIAVTWQLMILIIGYFISRSVTPSAELLAHTFHWDAGWYFTILNDQYQTNAASAAFYPLFPLSVGIISTVSFGLIDTLTAVQLINLAGLWLALVALLKISRYFLPGNYRYLPLLFLLSAPAAFFLHMFYSESVFIAIAFWAYAHALEKRWLFSCLLLAILTACRLPALLFIGLCFFEFCRSYDWRPRKILNKNLLFFALTPTGFVCYGAYLALVPGNFFAMFSAYKATDDWIYQVFSLNIFATVAKAIYQTGRALVGLRPFDHDIIVNHLIPLTCLGLLLASSLYLIIKIKGRAVPLGLFGLLSFVMFTLNSNVVSVHRYTLACLGVYIAISLFTINNKRSRPIVICFIIISLFVQTFLLNAFINNSFAG